jgi:hypothetical protein
MSLVNRFNNFTFPEISLFNATSSHDLQLKILAIQYNLQAQLTACFDLCQSTTCQGQCNIIFNTLSNRLSYLIIQAIKLFIGIDHESTDTKTYWTALLLLIIIGAILLVGGLTVSYFIIIRRIKQKEETHAHIHELEPYHQLETDVRSLRSSV